MARIYLKRRVTFSAGHAYWFADKTEDENRALFGKWASRYGHGHNYVAEATVAGDIDEKSGMVVNIVDVDRVLKKYVTGPLADKHLTYDVPHFRDTPATTENIARYIADRFNAHFTDPNAKLTRVVLWETHNLWATYDLEKNQMLLTRSLDFAASHRLHAPAFTDEENQTIFGKCNNPMGHGHNYGVEVTVSGTPDETTGMLVDLVALDKVIHQEVMERYDHKFLNGDVADFAHANPTTENLTREIGRAHV